MYPAGTTIATPNKKLQSSPTPAELVVVSLIMFLIRQTGMPAKGEITNAAISAGSSEKSSFTNSGINAGTGISKSCITAARADSIATTASFLMLVETLLPAVVFVVIINILFPNLRDFWGCLLIWLLRKNAPSFHKGALYWLFVPSCAKLKNQSLNIKHPHKKRGRNVLLNISDSFIRTIPSVSEFHRFNPNRQPKIDTSGKGSQTLLPVENFTPPRNRLYLYYTQKIYFVNTFRFAFWNLKYSQLSHSGKRGKRSGF